MTNTLNYLLNVLVLYIENDELYRGNQDKLFFQTPWKILKKKIVINTNSQYLTISYNIFIKYIGYI